jgi:hypothetical protein
MQETEAMRLHKNVNQIAKHFCDSSYHALAAAHLKKQKLRTFTYLVHQDSIISTNHHGR